jgi:hypothetical protein
VCVVRVLKTKEGVVWRVQDKSVCVCCLTKIKPKCAEIPALTLRIFRRSATKVPQTKIKKSKNRPSAAENKIKNKNADKI